MNVQSTTPVLRYGVAIVTSAAAFAVMITGQLGLRSLPMAALFAAVSITSWLGGKWPGALAVILCTGVLFYGLTTVAPTQDAGLIALDLIGFVVVAAGVQQMIVRAQSARDQAHAAVIEQAQLLTEAQEAMAMRDELLWVAAHELRTPVTSLRGYAQLVLRQLTPEKTPSPQRLRQAFQTLDEQTERLVKLMGQLLDLSRVETGKVELERNPTDVLALVNTVVASGQRSDSHPISVRDSSSPIIAAVDATRLEQVVRNLLDNAVKYSPEGGPIEVEVTAPNAETVRITIQDSGIGIPPELRDQIFERFYQAQSGRQFTGFGLGLYVTQQIVQLHGGQIEVEHPPDGGTRFVVTLPTATAPEASPTPAEVIQPAASDPVKPKE